ncbi:MAG: hypothetical protein J3K34DRAFT_235982 [Monoraphidium minutum]|nr:MAG: hypothetical protein J3K34DRAFT_235982 [Monoraphidium minutum]
MVTEEIWMLNHQAAVCTASTIPGYHLFKAPYRPNGAKYSITLNDFGVADKLLGYTNRVISDSIQGTVPSSWANMTKLWYLNLHQQIGMCAWSDDDTPFDIHLLAGRGNFEWFINTTANQDWTVQDSTFSRDSLRVLWGAKSPVWKDWNPLNGPYRVRDNTGDNDTRLVLQIFTPYNMTRLPFRCSNPTNTVPRWHFTRLPEEMMLWPLQQDDTCLKYVNTDASIWGLESCWTQWPRDNSWLNPYTHFAWSERAQYDENVYYTYADANLQASTLATSTYGYYEPFVQRTFRNMTYYGYQSVNDDKAGFWIDRNFADWSSTPWGPTLYKTSYKREPTWDWAWRYTGSFWYSNYHFPMVTGMVQQSDLRQGTIRGRHHWGNNQCLGQCGGLVYNNHVFVDWRDRRMGNSSFDFSVLNYTHATFSGDTIQSLPDFDNPCERIWQRYFSSNTTHRTWFTSKHNVNRSQMLSDCNSKVIKWQGGVMQIRIIRNVTKPVSSHNIQAARPSNLDSMNAAFHLEDRSIADGYPGTLRSPIHYDGPTQSGSKASWKANIGWSNLLYPEQSPHNYFNPNDGSILTKAASWPPEVAQSLGFDTVPGFQLKDSEWWNDIAWYFDPVLSAAHSPAERTAASRRYWEWNPRFPSSYPKYHAPWPNSTWNGASWPAHLYGTLPSSWGALAPATGAPNLPNLRIIDLHDVLRTGKLKGFVPRSWLDNIHELSMLNLYGHREICNNMEHDKRISIKEYVHGLRGRVGGPPDWTVANQSESYFYWEARFDVKWNNNSKMAAESCLYNSLDTCYVGYPSQRNDTYAPNTINPGFGDTLPDVLIKPDANPSTWEGPIIYPYLFDPWMPIGAPAYTLGNQSLNPNWAWGEFFEGYDYWLHVPWTNTNPSVHQRDTFSSVSFLGASRLYDATGDPEAVWLPRRMRRLWILLDPWTQACCDHDTDCDSGSCMDSRCEAPSCSDNILNGFEWEIDCGGGCKCKTGQRCTNSSVIDHSSCLSGICNATSELCLAPTCSDGIMNGDEPDIDCGSPLVCPSGNRCPTYKGCNQDDDCASFHCFVGTNYTCAQPTCQDGRHNGDETDVDCGGPTCPLCKPTKKCSDNTSCDSGVCLNTSSTYVCAFPTCDDGVHNGNETDADCGGSVCPACDIAALCKLDTDCLGSANNTSFCKVPATGTRLCTALHATCSDTQKNGDESDADCGGSSCFPCASHLQCSIDTECISRVCLNTTCAEPTCLDNVVNGLEVDVDCGGPCNKCQTGATCLRNEDCDSMVCSEVCTTSSCRLSCRPPSCFDTIRNGDETGIDCGGGVCPSCPLGSNCTVGTDCRSGFCSSVFQCNTPTCSDGVQNGPETDVDCGANCAKCEDFKICLNDADCSSSYCVNHTCAEPTCSDGRKNGLETDIDCGKDCVRCGHAKNCSIGDDCQSRVCHQSLCSLPSCTDGQLNGDESDIDCGGACNGCVPLADCRTSSDCASGVCTDNSCVAPTCSDGIRNGLESDLDCGGGCQGCDVSLKCKLGSDCATGACMAYKCMPPACDDGIKNGNESDIDCGGQQCSRCPASMECQVDSDCLSMVCVSTSNSCGEPSCSDTVQNGDETDIDCGGTCAPCPDGRTCLGNLDCLSERCSSGTCSCGDGQMNGDETDIDCGGSCLPCADGKSCSADMDCQSKVCPAIITSNSTLNPTLFKCFPSSCDDGTLNGNETDVDCGGLVCPPCSSTLKCQGPSDCESQVCNELKTCESHSCLDGVKNGKETSIDCGGGDCPQCMESLACLISEDCASGACVGLSCLPATCDDGIINGQETDLDCGGLQCRGCPASMECQVDSDCLSMVCVSTSNSCGEPSCSDTVQNGDETDIDCGGTCAPCPDGRTCLGNLDCLSERCSSGTCSCGDGQMNGDETDIDCGGSCLPCADGKSCSADMDCQSMVCDPTDERCLKPSCQDTIQNGNEAGVDCGGMTCPRCSSKYDCPSRIAIYTNDVSNLQPLLINLDVIGGSNSGCFNLTCLVILGISPSDSSVQIPVDTHMTSLKSSNYTLLVPESTWINISIISIVQVSLVIIKPDNGEVCNITQLANTVQVDREPPTLSWMITETAASYSGILITFSENVMVNVSQIQVARGALEVQDVNQSSLKIIANGIPGSRITIAIPAGCYQDFVGNPGTSTAIIEVDIPPFDEPIRYIANGLEAVVPATAAIASAASLTSAAMYVISATSVTQSLIAKGNMVRAGYHLQIMSMSANLAVGNVPDTYKFLVKQLGWSTLNIQVDELSQFTKKPVRDFTASTKTQGRRMLESSPPTRNGLRKDLLSTGVVAAIVVGGVFVVHLIFIICWTFFLNKVLPIVFIMPCIEVLVLGYVFVALSFYASIPLGKNVPASDKEPASLAIHVAVCLPYMAFLVWMALQRSSMFLFSEGNTPSQPDQVSKLSSTLLPAVTAYMRALNTFDRLFKRHIRRLMS